MNIQKPYLLFLLFFIIFKSQAGDTIVGNGGDVLVCRTLKGEITNVMLYDYYEGKVRRGLVYDLGPKDLNYQEKIKIAVSRIEKHNKVRAKLYRDWFKEFLKPENTIFTNNRLSDIPDTGEVIYPEGCEVVQVAHQLEPLPGEKRYYIRKDLWQLMSNDDKAGLVLHELIYREAKYHNSYSHPNSKRVRYFNATIAADDLKHSSNKEYVLLIRDIILLDIADVSGIPIKLFTNTRGSFGELGQITKTYISFHANRNISSAYVESGTKISYTHRKQLITGVFNSEKDGALFSFYDNGQVKTLSLGKKTRNPYGYKNVSKTLKELTQYISLEQYGAPSKLYFTKKGDLKKVIFWDTVTYLLEDLRITPVLSDLKIRNEKFIGNTELYQKAQNKYRYKSIWYKIYKEIKFSQTIPGKVIFICMKNGFQMKCGEPESIVKWKNEKPLTVFSFTSKCEKKVKKIQIMYKASGRCDKYAKGLSTLNWKEKYVCSFKPEECIKTKCGRSKRIISCESEMSLQIYKPQTIIN